MNILFGPEHDSVHIDPMQPAAYEWWYFDALSDDGKQALCVIFSLGSPMTPYYKAVVDGMHPFPCDWCSVFITLHELEQGQWKTRSYANNLYRYRKNLPDWFQNTPLRIKIGGSELQGIYPPDSSGFPHRWQITIDEPGLWSGRTRATLDFAILGSPLTHEPLNTDTDPQTWVCVAPLCTISGEISQPDGQKVSFSGRGYHDHHYGQLPWKDVGVWYWGHAAIIEPDRAGSKNKEKRVPTKSLVHYVVTSLDEGSHQLIAILLNTAGQIELTLTNGQFEANYPTNDIPEDAKDMLLHPWPVTNAYGLPVPLSWKLTFDKLSITAKHASHSSLLTLESGPYYARLASWGMLWNGRELLGVFADDKPLALSAVFRPSRLCHPLWSRLMWLWMRRRS